jgi:hypothetical protein
MEPFYSSKRVTNSVKPPIPSSLVYSLQVAPKLLMPVIKNILITIFPSTSEWRRDYGEAWWKFVTIDLKLVALVTPFKFQPCPFTGGYTDIK